jgi:hypothetical protein
MANNRLTPQWLFRLWIVITLLGIFLPGISIVLKLAANDFYGWNRMKESPETTFGFISQKLPMFERKGGDFKKFLEDHPVFDISKSMPFLSAISWHSKRRLGRALFYVRYSIMNVIILVIILAIRSKLIVRFEKICEWYAQPTHRFERKLILVVAVFIVASYQTKLYAGFWVPGISGWTYANRTSQIRSELPSDITPGGEIPEFIRSAIIEENAPHVSGSGYLSGNAMFLHYSTGETLPATYELVQIVFPGVVFGNLYREVKHPEVFADIVKSSLDKANRNKKLMLPVAISYPNHTQYQPVPYRTYPPAQSLEKISMWTLVIKIDDDKHISIVRASEGGVINVN